MSGQTLSVWGPRSWVILYPCTQATITPSEQGKSTGIAQVAAVYASQRGDDLQRNSTRGMQCCICMSPPSMPLGRMCCSPPSSEQEANRGKREDPNDKKGEEWGKERRGRKGELGGRTLPICELVAQMSTWIELLCSSLSVGTVLGSGLLSGKGVAICKMKR